MTDDPTESTEARGLMWALLTPLRTPQRVVGNIETIASALLALQRDTREHLASLDDRVGGLLAPLNRLDRRVTELQKLEEAMTEQTNAIREDLRARMLAVEEEVGGMRDPMERISRDLATVVKLLPNPSDGPIARLRDTFTSS
jgi:predicted  nucleic acid-binding Zn-ribbon protein